MTYTEFKDWAKARGLSEKEAARCLIKAKHPCVRKLRGKGKFELVDECGTPFARTKGLKVSW